MIWKCWAFRLQQPETNTIRLATYTEHKVSGFSILKIVKHPGFTQTFFTQITLRICSMGPTLPWTHPLAISMGWKATDPLGPHSSDTAPGQATYWFLLPLMESQCCWILTGLQQWGTTKPPIPSNLRVLLKCRVLWRSLTLHPSKCERGYFLPKCHVGKKPVTAKTTGSQVW